MHKNLSNILIPICGGLVLGAVVLIGSLFSSDNSAREVWATASPATMQVRPSVSLPSLTTGRSGLSASANTAPLALAMMPSASVSAPMHTSSAATTHSYGGGNATGLQASSASTIAGAQQASYAIPVMQVMVARPKVYGVGANLASTEFAAISAPAAAPKRNGPPPTITDPDPTEDSDLHHTPLGDAVMPLLLLLLGYVFIRRRQVHA